MRTPRVPIVAASLLLLAGLLAGCDGSPETAASPAASDSPDAAPTSEAPSPSPTPTSAPIAIPDDCREILSADVLAQLEGIPLNDPGVGPSGVQEDGSLTCIWRDPRTDTTALMTQISAMQRGPALDKLNALADDQGFVCSTPDGGTRCEKTWANDVYPVTDGRTLFWRDDILIDTGYSNLAPTGYTSSIVAHLFG